MLSRLLQRFAQLDRSTRCVLWAGLLARLIIMPFAAHSDLMTTYWDAHLVLFHEKFPGGFQALLRCFHAGYLWLLTPVLPSGDSLWMQQAAESLVNPFLSSQGWFSFVSQPHIYRTLFLFKLPYLLADLACVYLLYRLGSDRDKSRLMIGVWWLNPILLFATYIFGRHEVFALFFVLLSVYLLKRGSWRGGLFAVGMAIAIRYYAILLLPFYVLSLQPAWRKRLQGLTIALAPWLIVNLAAWAVVGVAPARGLINLPHDNYLLSMKFEIAEWDNVYVFPLVYLLLVIYRLYDRQYGWRSVPRYSLIALLLLFATSYTGQSPQYWTWFIPLLAIEVAEDRRLLPLHVAQVLCLAVYGFIGGRSTAGYLFASLAPDFFWSLPSPVEIISRFASPEMVISLARTAFSAVTLWMVYLVFRRMRTTSVLGNDLGGVQ